MSMTSRVITMSVFQETWEANAEHIHKDGYGALWLQSGSLHRNDIPIEEGSGFCLCSGDRVVNASAAPVSALHFTLNASAATQPDHSRVHINETMVLSSDIKTTMAEVVFRLDQVDFPPAAVAYRHTHPGAGIRYLVKGGLQIASDHSLEKINPGQAWFEEADSPVEATAIDTIPSSFVRAMLLPVKYAGRPTLTLVNDADASKPRLQTNTRYFDQQLSVSAIH